MSISFDYERLHHIGHIEIEYGNFQTVFKNYLEKKPSAENYSFDSNENSMTFKTEVKKHILIFEAEDEE